MSIKTFDSSHIKSPFTYQVNSGDKIIDKTLSTSQIITAIAIGILLSPLLIVGGYLSFLGVTAAFKNKNIAAWNKDNPPKPKDLTEEVVPLPSKPETAKLDEDVKSIVPPEKISQIADSNLKRDELDSNQPKLSVEIPKIISVPVESKKEIVSIEPQKNETPAPTNVIAGEPSFIHENNPLLGKKISTEEALELIDLIDDTLSMDELVLVLRSDGNYQYAKFKGYGAPGFPNNGQFDCGEGKINNKPITDFHKIYDQKSSGQKSITPSIDQDQIVFSSESPQIEKMKAYLSTFTNYDPVFRTIHFNGNVFSVIGSKSESFACRPTALCGSDASREVITLDPSNSPRLKMHLDQLIIWLRGKEGNENLIINTVSEYVGRMIFPNRNPSIAEAQLADFINSKKLPGSQNSGVQVPIISIEEFIGTEIASSRHHALVTAYLLDGLTKCNSIWTGKPFLSGEVKVLMNDLVGYEVVFDTEKHEVHMTRHSLPIFLSGIPK